jgi:hypothetical protein
MASTTYQNSWEHGLKEEQWLLIKNSMLNKDSTKQYTQQEDKESCHYAKKPKKYGERKGRDAKHSDDDGPEEATTEEH